MSILNKYPHHSPNTASRLVDGEAVVVTPGEGTVRILNETGSRVWELSDGKKNIGELVSIIENEFSVTTEIAKSDILELISDLENKNLMVIKDEPTL